MNLLRAGIGLGVAWLLVGAYATSAATIVVNPGESIQAAVDAAAPGDTIRVRPGDYIETHGGTAAVRITKRLKLLAQRNRLEPPVRILPGPGNRHGILVEPANPGDPDVEGVRIRGFIVEGFEKNGIWLRHTRRFRIEENTSINNLENGIFPTLSANGLVKRNVAYGSEDTSLWVESSENVRVIQNDFSGSPTGLEITVSRNVLAKRNTVHDNSVGIGLYHPSAASLPRLGNDGDWKIVNNRVYNNNAPNNAPPGSMSAELPSGGGVLVLGVDRVTLRNNVIENNDFFGIAILDWCLAVDGTPFDCDTNPPEVESSPDNNKVVRNRVINNGGNPPGGFFGTLASDILYLGGVNNCFSGNVANLTIPATLPGC